MRIETSMRVSSTSSRIWSLIAPSIVMGTWQWSWRLRVGVLRRQRMRLHVKVRDFVNLVSLARHCACPLIHPNHLCVVGVACARAPAVLGVSSSSSSFPSAPASFAAVAHARSTPMHDAHNSWSDTGRVQGPTERRCTKGGVSGPAEDLRLVSEVEAGVNFRPAGGVRGQVAGSLPRRQPGTGTRQVRGGAVTPSLHPEVPDTRFASPGRGLGIRQSMGWMKVCSTARSGIWVLKGGARACMLPANLDHLRVGWRPRGSYKTARVTPGHDCRCPYQYGRGAAVRPQSNDAIWDGVLGLWSRVAPLLSPWCARGNVPTEVNLNRYSGSGSCIPWHSDNESLFGPPNQPKLIVSMSLGHSVVFQGRRVPGDVPPSITLDHGDLVVMDGPAQSEYAHHTVSGLQGPRVNLTYRWVTQHAASRVPEGVGWGKINGPLLGNWSSFCQSWCLCLLISTWIHIRRGHRHSGHRPSCPVVHFPSRGRARWVGGRRWRLSQRRQSP